MPLKHVEPQNGAGENIVVVTPPDGATEDNKDVEPQDGASENNKDGIIILLAGSTIAFIAIASYLFVKNQQIKRKIDP